MKLAVIGAGISGMLVAHLLCDEHDVTVFEAADYLGGHTHTVRIELDGRAYDVDTGFIVFNDRTYPNFIKLMDRLGVASRPSAMSFSVKCEKSGLEYNGTTVNTLFAQRRNLFRPTFYRMIGDILRFNREATRLLDTEDHDMTLGDYLAPHEYSPQFIEHYIIPMGSAIWSAGPEQMRQFPARTFVQFFHNHGMLSVNDRPQWRVISGGSRRYVEPLTRPFRDRVRTNCPIESVSRRPDHVEVRPRSGRPERFDRVIFSTHSDQALDMLADPTPQEKDVLGALPYQPNEAILHTDASVLPRRRRAWAAWNYHILREGRGRVAVTYNMNILQGLQAPATINVTLNHADAISPDKILRRITYHHPVYTREGVAARRRYRDVSGVNRTYYCGAYWGFGFHEDGVKSALAVCKEFGKGL